MTLSLSLFQFGRPASLLMAGVALSLLTTLGGCGGGGGETTASPAASPAVAASTSPEASPAASPVASTAASPAASPATAKSAYPELIAVVDGTKAAVAKGDFAAAKTEFGKFEGAWKTIEDGIKDKTPKAYKAIEASADTLKDALKGDKPDAAKVTAELDALTKGIAEAETPAKK